MSVEEDSTPDAASSGGLYAVGTRLAAERRQQQREVAAVANDLHLRPEVVNALEAGDESRLPANAFVRGYVKSYARLLGLSETELMALMPAAEVSRPVPLKPVGMRRRAVRLPIGKWLLWIAGLLLLAALVVYGVPVVERLLNKGEPMENGDALPLPEDGDMPVLELPGPAELPDPIVEPEPETTADEAPVTELPTAAEAEPVAEEKPPVAPVEPEPAAGPATIVLEFSQDSWVEMESNGRKLVVGTQPAGSERTVRAEPPITILLGNAPGVTVTYRGERVDLKPHQRGKVVRLVLED